MSDDVLLLLLLDDQGEQSHGVSGQVVRRYQRGGGHHHGDRVYVGQVLDGGESQATAGVERHVEKFPDGEGEEEEVEEEEAIAEKHVRVAEERPQDGTGERRALGPRWLACYAPIVHTPFFFVFFSFTKSY